MTTDEQTRQDAVKLRIIERLNECVHLIGKEAVITAAIDALYDFVDQSKAGEMEALEDAAFNNFGLEL